MADLNLYFETISAKKSENLLQLNQKLRTALVTIKGYTDMLLDERFGKLSKLQQEKLHEIQKNVDILIDSIFLALENNASMSKE